MIITTFGNLPTYGPAGGGQDPSALYQNTLSGYQQQQSDFLKNQRNINAGYGGMLNQLGMYGAGQKLNLLHNYQTGLASQQQQLASRGLGNSTLLESAARGANLDYNNSMMQLNDQLIGQRLGIMGQRLNYLGGAQQGLAAIQGQGLQYQGSAQQAAQAQAVQQAMQAQQLNSQNMLANRGYNVGLMQQSMQNQNASDLANQQYLQQMSLQNQFGYY